MFVSDFYLRSAFYRFASPRSAIAHLRNDAEKPSKTFALGLSEVEAIEVHHLVPHRHKVIYKFLLRVLRSVDLCKGA